MFQPLARGGRHFRQGYPGRIQSRTILVESGVPIFFEVEDASQINVRPCDYVGLVRCLQRSFEVRARPIDVTVLCRNFGQNEQCASGIFFLTIERLLRQLLRGFPVARGQPPLGV